MPSVIRHIPDTLHLGRTYCGRDISSVSCIDTKHDNIESAECRGCQRVDDKRSVQDYRLQVECKTCGASIGFPCVNYDGKPVDAHFARSRLCSELCS